MTIRDEGLEEKNEKLRLAIREPENTIVGDRNKMGVRIINAVDGKHYLSIFTAFFFIDSTNIHSCFCDVGCIMRTVFQGSKDSLPLGIVQRQNTAVYVAGGLIRIVTFRLLGNKLSNVCQMSYVVKHFYFKKHK